MFNFHNHSFYKQFLSICILIFLLPLFICSIILFSFEKETNATANELNSSQLNLARSTIDSVINAANVVNNKITESPEFKTALDSNVISTQNSLAVFKQLSDFVNDNNLVSNAFIYFKESDTIISNNSIESSNNYYGNYFADSDMSYSEWCDVFLNKFYLKQLSVPIAISDFGKSTNCISYISTITKNSYSTILSAQFVVLLDYERILNVLSTGITDGYNTMIVKDKSEVLLSKNNVKDDIYLSGSADVKFKQTGNEYIFYVSSQQLSDITYASTIKKQSVMLDIVVFYVAYIVFISVLIIVLFKNNYKPIINLMLSLYNKRNAKDITVRELHTAKIQLDEILSSEKQLHIITEKQKRINDNYALLNFLRNKELIPNKYISSLGLQNYRYFTVANLIFDENSVMDSNTDEHYSLTHFAITNILKDIVMEPVRYYTVESSITSMVIIFCTNDEELSNTVPVQTASLLHDLIKEIYDTEVTVCIGNTHIGIDEIKNSHYESTIPITNRIPEQTNGVILYSNYIKNSNPNAIIYYSANLETQLINYVRLGDYENAIEVFEQITASNSKNGTLTSDTKQKIHYTFYGTFCKLIHYLNETDKNYNAPDIEYPQFNAEDSIAKMTGIIKTLCEEFANMSNINKNAQITIQNIKTFIEKNYNNPNLSLVMIADYIGITPQYLSNLFKTHETENLSHYITRTRVEEAKRLLITTKLSITEISEAIGYANNASFTKMFKKNENVSPKTFRKNHGNN